MIPEVLQDWVAKKILAVGATLEVHPYTEREVKVSFERQVGRVGTEVHFYPAAKRIVAYHVTKKQLGHSLHLSHD